MLTGNSISHVKQGAGSCYSKTEVAGYYNDLTEKVTKDDPGFEDYNNKDFTLKDDSEVFAQISGFPKLDFKNMGIEDTEAVGVLK